MDDQEIMSKINENILKYIMTNKLDSSSNGDEKWYMKLAKGQIQRIKYKVKTVVYKYLNKQNSKFTALAN